MTVENGRLYTQRSGGERLEVRPGSETEFFYDKSLTRLRFVLDASGRATEMLFFPEGADEPEHAPRVADAPADAHGGEGRSRPVRRLRGRATSSPPASSSP